MFVTTKFLIYISVPPAAVGDLRVLPISSSQLNVTWTASKYAEVYSVSYRLIDLYQCGGSTPIHTHDTWRSAGNFTGLSARLSDLEPNSRYEVSVIAYNVEGYSRGSSEIGSTNGGPSMYNIITTSYISLFFSSP